MANFLLSCQPRGAGSAAPLQEVATSPGATRRRERAEVPKVLTVVLLQLEKPRWCSAPLPEAVDAPARLPLCVAGVFAEGRGRAAKVGAPFQIQAAVLLPRV